MNKQNLEIEALRPDNFEGYLNELAALLNACVADGASVNFVLPHSINDSREFWSEQVRPALAKGVRVLLVAKVEGRLAGSVQLDYDTPPNQPHRVEIAKLLVHPDFRRCGIARALMAAIEDQVKQLGRHLITLDTASNGAERLYLSMGYNRVGVIPGFAKDPLVDRFDATTIMFKKL